MRSRFMTATQQLLRRLVCSERRKSVERTRADKARTLAMRAACRSATADAEAGTMPNAGLALCAALSTYERVTCAMDAEASLPADVEAAVVAASGDFFAAHLLGCSRSGRGGARSAEQGWEVRPAHEGLALATLYLMREGIPGVLPQSRYLAMHLPELARLKTYGCKVSQYTQSRRYIQSTLEARAQQRAGPQKLELLS
jgi:hypothetical protein